MADKSKKIVVWFRLSIGESKTLRNNTMITDFIDELTYPDPAGRTPIIAMLRQYRRRLPPTARVARGAFTRALRAAGYVLARNCSGIWVIVGRSRHGGKHCLVIDDRVTVVR